jgi:hypothetical protein
MHRHLTNVSTLAVSESRRQDCHFLIAANQIDSVRGRVGPTRAGRRFAAEIDCPSDGVVAATLGMARSTSMKGPRVHWARRVFTDFKALPPSVQGGRRIFLPARSRAAPPSDCRTRFRWLYRAWSKIRRLCHGRSNSGTCLWLKDRPRMRCHARRPVNGQNCVRYGARSGSCACHENGRLGRTDKTDVRRHAN